MTLPTPNNYFLLAALFELIVFLPIMRFIVRKSEEPLSWPETQGTVTAVEMKYIGDNQIGISFSANGTALEVRTMPPSNSSYKVGDSIKVFFNPQNPNQYALHREKLPPALMYGAVFFAALVTVGMSFYVNWK